MVCHMASEPTMRALGIMLIIEGHGAEHKKLLTSCMWMAGESAKNDANQVGNILPLIIMPSFG